MPPFGLVGPTYQAQSLTANAQRCVNWIIEKDESGTGKSPMQMYPLMGLRTFANLPGENAVFGHFRFNDRAFAVGNHLWELSQTGVATDRGTLQAPTGPVTFAANHSNQLLILTGGVIYVYNLSTNAAPTPVPSSVFDGAAISQIAFNKSYFVALRKDSSIWQLSALEDGTTWNALDINQIEDFPDNAVSMFVAYEELWFQGKTRSVGLVPTSDIDQPFLPAPGAFAHEGSAAVHGHAIMDNTAFWWGESEIGGRMAWRADGYRPSRISNHAIENEVQGYSTVADLECYAFKFKGHTYFASYFPTAKKFWLYDAATQFWTEAQGADGGAYPARCHMYAFGKHLVGDPKAGKVYEMSDAFLDLDGQPMTRFRRAPHVARENKLIRHNRLEIHLETGLPMAQLLDGNGNPRDAQMMLRWSDDGGHKWSNEYILNCGRPGEYSQRIIKRRLGASRSRVYEIKVTDPLPWRIVEAYLEAA